MTVTSDSADKHLRAGALGLTGVLMQAVTHIGPAVGFILSIGFITSLAGVAAPVSFLAAFLITLLLGISLTQLARRLPSAGGYYTYVTQTIGPKTGFLTAWVYFLYDPTVAAINFAWLGGVLEGVLRTQYDVHVQWWVFFLAGTALVTAANYFGVKISAAAMVILGGLEIAVIVGLALTGAIDPGPGGVSLMPFNPGEATSFNALYLGVVFAIFSFTGFESVAPLAEESRDPTRTLPRAIIISILVAGAFYLVSAWGVLVGWGTQDIPSFVAEENPVFALAHRLWGGAWVVVLIALVNSVIAVAIAGQNAATRVFYAMGRAGTLPRGLARIHPRHRTPVNALWLQTAITLALGLGGGFILGPQDTLFFFALSITLTLVVVYSAGNLGVFRLYRYTHRDEFRPLLHVVCPLLGTAAVVWVAYKSVNPLPDDPVRYAPLVAGGWLLLGLVITFVLARRGDRELRRVADSAHADAPAAEPPAGAGVGRRDA